MPVFLIWRVGPVAADFNQVEEYKLDSEDSDDFLRHGKKIVIQKSV